MGDKVGGGIMAVQLLYKCDSYCPSRASSSSVARPKLEEVLQSTFHHESFRPGQLEALLPVAHGKDVVCAHAYWWWQDVFALGCGAIGKSIGWSN